MCRARASVTVVAVMSVVFANVFVPGSKNSAFTVGVLKFVVYPPARSTRPAFFGAVGGILTAVWKARGDFMVIGEEQSPVRSQTTAVFSTVPVSVAPPAIRTFPASRAVTVTPCRAAELFEFNRNHAPGAIVAVAVATAVAPARLVTVSLYRVSDWISANVVLVAPAAMPLIVAVPPCALYV